MSDQLETRYRRLLAWYPWEHRRMYEDEMLGVLMAGARPGQRYPRLADAANLLVSAGWRRLGGAVRGLAGAEWRDAAAVVGLLGALLLLGLRLHPYGRSLAAAWWGENESRLIAPAMLAPRLVIWVLVVAAALAGLRRTAAAASWVAVAGETVLAVLRFRDDAPEVIFGMWPYVLAVVTATALTVPAAPRRAAVLLGRRWLVVAGVGVLIAVAGPVIGVLSAGGVGGASVYDELARGSVTTLRTAVYLAGGLLVAAAVWRLPAPVRRRVVVFFVPVLAAQVVVEQSFSGWRYSTWHMGHGIPLAPTQWALLVLTPALTFAVGVAVVRWREERARLIALARATDRAA